MHACGNMQKKFSSESYRELYHGIFLELKDIHRPSEVFAPSACARPTTATAATTSMLNAAEDSHGRRAHVSWATCPFVRPWEQSQRCVGHNSRHKHTTTVDGAKLARLLTNVTISVMGDSMNVQLGIAFACRMLHHVPLTEHHLEWHCSKTKKPCDPSASEECPEGGGFCRYDSGCGYFANGLRLCMCQASDVGGMRKMCIEHRATPSRSGPLYDDADHRRVVVYGTYAIHGSQQRLLRDGTPVPYFRDWRERASSEVEMVLETFVTSRKPTGYPRDHPLLIWRSATPQHWSDSPGGRFVANGTQLYVRHASNMSAYECVDRSFEALRALGQPDWNEVALPRLRTAGIPVIDAWSGAAVSWDGHVGVHDHDGVLDCTHFCYTSGVTSNWSAQLEHLLLSALENRTAHARALDQRQMSFSNVVWRSALPAGFATLPSLVKHPGVCTDTTIRVGDSGGAWQNNSLERLAPHLYHSVEYMPVQHKYKNASAEHKALWMYANGGQQKEAGWTDLWYRPGRTVAFADMYSALLFTGLSGWPHPPPIGHFATGADAIRALRDTLSPHFETLVFLRHVDAVNACPPHNGFKAVCCSKGTQLYTEVVALRGWAFGKCPGHENLSLTPPHPCKCRSNGLDPREFC